MQQQQWKQKVSSSVRQVAKEEGKRPSRVLLEEIGGSNAICLIRHNILGTRIRGLADDLDVDEMEAVLKGVGVRPSDIHVIKNRTHGNSIGVYAFVEDVPGVVVPRGVKPSPSSSNHAYLKKTRQQERRQQFRQAYAKSVVEGRAAGALSAAQAAASPKPPLVNYY